MLTEEYSIPIKNKRSVRPRTIKEYTRTKGLSDHGPSKSIHEQQAYQIKDHQRLYKNKRPIRPRTLKDYTRTRGLPEHGPLKTIQESDHRPSKVIQEQEAIRSRTINDCTRTIRSKTIKQEKRPIRLKTIKNYTRTNVYQTKDHQRLYKNQYTEEQFAGNWFKLMSSLARQMYAATVFPRDCKRLQQLR